MRHEYHTVVVKTAAEDKADRDAWQKELYAPMRRIYAEQEVYHAGILQRVADRKLDPQCYKWVTWLMVWAHVRHTDVLPPGNPPAESSGREAPTDSHGTDPVQPHAAEVLGELASYRADIAALRALLNVTLDNRIEEMDGRIRTIEHKLNLI